MLTCHCMNTFRLSICPTLLLSHSAACARAREVARMEHQQAEMGLSRLAMILA